MAKADYLLAGHSHVFAMGAAQGYQGPLDLVKTPDGRGYFVMERFTGLRSPAYWEKLVEAAGGRDVLIVFNGNQHNGAFLLAPDPLFDFFDELTPDLLDGATVVPRRLVEAFFNPSLDRLRLLVPRLLSAGCRSVRLVSGPPPQSDIQLFADMIRETGYFKRFAQNSGIDLNNTNITPASLLLKLWRVINDITARAAADERVAFVSVPPEALDANGFLAKRFYAYTPAYTTHANTQFGQLMLQRSLETLES